MRTREWEKYIWVRRYKYLKGIPIGVYSLQKCGCTCGITHTSHSRSAGFRTLYTTVHCASSIEASKKACVLYERPSSTMLCQPSGDWITEMQFNQEWGLLKNPPIMTPYYEHFPCLFFWSTEHGERVIRKFCERLKSLKMWLFGRTCKISWISLGCERCLVIGVVIPL